jgi:predicted neuraminidase
MSGTLGLDARDVKNCRRFARSECTTFREGRDLRFETEFVRKVLDCLTSAGRDALAAAVPAYFNLTVEGLDDAAADAVLAAFPALGARAE